MESLYPLIPDNRADDIHNLDIMDNADLVLFMAGNQFMAMPELIREFQKKHPEVKKIFSETLPPGLELQQILKGGARFMHQTLTGRPDVYTSVTEEAMHTLQKAGKVEKYGAYLHNRLVIMVRKGNPKNILKVADLGREDVRVSEPGALEHISRYIERMYLKAGGEELRNQILDRKRELATSIYTLVHHRETPLRITHGTVDAGPVWATEVISAKKQGLEVEAVEPGKELDMRQSVNYYSAVLTDGPNVENGLKFDAFLRSNEARGIFEKYGFVV